MSSDALKDIVRRFNQEVIQEGKRSSFDELIDPTFVNRTAPASSNDKEGMWNTIANVLRPAFPDLRVLIHQQIAEGDCVTTRKTIEATHTGTLLGIPATNKRVVFDVIDIVRLKDGKYLEHWGINTFEKVVGELKAISASLSGGTHA